MKIRYIIFLVIPVIVIQNCTQKSPEQPEPAIDPSISTPSWYDPGRMDTVRIVTWNVEHFVDPYNDPYIDNEREDIPPSEMGKRRELFAAAIRNLDADVVVLQEFESDSYLRHLAENHFPEMGYRVFAAHESPDWYMNVVMMSRIPLGTFYSYAHVNTPITGYTDTLGNPQSQTFVNNRMWSADVLVNPDYTFTITGLHLKAGQSDRNRAWRMGQINLLRARFRQLMKLDPDRNMVVVGDLNSTPGSEEFQRFLGNSSEAVRFIDPLKNTEAFSHPSDSLFWRIDHILPNTHMNPELVPESVTIARPLVDEQMIMISDHLPVKASFVAKEKK